MDKENVLYLYNSALIRREILSRGTAIMNPEDITLSEISHKRTNIGGSDGKASSCNVGDLGSIPGSGSPPGEGNGYPLPYFCLENCMDRGALQAIIHRITKIQTQFSY